MGKTSRARKVFFCSQQYTDESSTAKQKDFEYKKNIKYLEKYPRIIIMFDIYYAILHVASITGKKILIHFL